MIFTNYYLSITGLVITSVALAGLGNAMPVGAATEEPPLIIRVPGDNSAVHEGKLILLGLRRSATHVKTAN